MALHLSCAGAWPGLCREGRRAQGPTDSRGWKPAGAQVALHDFKQAVRGREAGSLRQNRYWTELKPFSGVLASFPTSSSEPLVLRPSRVSGKNMSVCREAARMGPRFGKLRSPSFTEKQMHSFVDYCKAKTLYIIFFASLL